MKVIAAIRLVTAPLTLTTIALILLTVPAIAQENDDWSPAQREVLDAEVARNNAWAEGDFETFMALTHPRWLRWSMGSAKLMSRDDYARFWDDMKADEKIVSMDVDPVSIEVFGDAAVAHFITTEELIWTGEPGQFGDKTLEAGDPFTVRLRWSDFWVKEGGHWLVVGGHRDGLCELRDGLNEHPDEICQE